MYLSAAIVPPLDLRQALHDEITSLTEEVVSHPPAPRSRWRRAQESVPVSPPPPPDVAVRVTSAENMIAPLTRFGFVDPGESSRLHEAIAQLMTSYEPPLLSLGEKTHIDSARNLLLLELSGETELLLEVFHALHETVRRRGFFQDRRTFDLSVPLTLVAPSSEGDRVGRIRRALDGYRSDPWPMSALTLVRQQFSAGAPHMVVVSEAHFGAERGHRSCCIP